MHDATQVDDAVDLLQSLGLKEYEAKCFVALSRVDSGTAKDVSDLSAVPRTRVYDAVNALADRGLVETRDSNPQRFRAVPVEEAAATLRNDYVDRIGDLEATLTDLPAAPDGDDDAVHEVWALSGAAAVDNRAERLLAAAGDAAVLAVGRETALPDGLVEELADAAVRGVDLAVGTVDATVRETVQDRVPDAEVFGDGLDWLRAGGNVDADDVDADDAKTSGGSDGPAAVTRLLLVDGEAALVGSTPGDDEHAVVARGAGNGVVLLARGLLASTPLADPGPLPT